MCTPLIIMRGVTVCLDVQRSTEPPRGLDVASHDRVLDAALVGAAQDLEEALLAPRLVPGVDAQPVGGAILHAPADHLDRVAAQVGASDVLVHTAGVGLEILVHGHGHGDSALLHDLLLHVGGGLHGVRGGGHVLVGRVGSAVGGLAAGGRAGGGLVRLDLGAAHHASGGIDMVGAGLQRVGLAGAAGAHLGVVSARRHASLREPLPGTGGLAAVAAVGEAAVDAGAAVVGVLGGEDGVGVSGGDAVAVVEGLGRAERPAGAAVGLVAHAASHDGAGGPGSADVEADGDVAVGGLEDGLLQLGLLEAVVAAQHRAEHHLHVGHGGVGESGGHLRAPGGLLGVN
mmetsp:Transcript_34018/g.73500  ORF Transcript_34018/g.73500 Transcript_34018/m.73500 type:complete len:343 (+) Transcript_34018:79-1107(+)